MHDQRVLESTTDELNILQAEVDVLLKVLTESTTTERELERLVNHVEDELEAWETMTELMEFSKRTQRIQEQLDADEAVIRAKLDAVTGQAMLQYAEDEKERVMLSSFNQDVHQIYDSAQHGLDEMEKELAQIKLLMQQQQQHEAGEEQARHERQQRESPRSNHSNDG